TIPCTSWKVSVAMCEMSVRGFGDVGRIDGVVSAGVLNGFCPVLSADKASNASVSDILCPVCCILWKSYLTADEKSLTATPSDCAQDFLPFQSWTKDSVVGFGTFAIG